MRALLALGRAVLLVLLLANTAHAQALSGAWGGTLMDQRSQTRVSILIEVRNDKLLNYLWDGRKTPIERTERRSDGLHLIGPYTHLIVTQKSPKGLDVRSVDNNHTGQLRLLPNRPAARPPVFVAEFYSKPPRKGRQKLALSSTYLDPNCCFGAIARPGPHAGIDFASERHAEVLAAADGQVARLFSTFEGLGCGNGLALRHGRGFYTVYCHLEALTPTRRGAKIRAGTVLGYVGSTGRALRNEPHLHFELNRDGWSHYDGDVARTFDPLSYFQACGSTPTNGEAFTMIYPIKCRPGDRLE